MENEIQFLFYSMPDEQGKVQVVVKDGTIWCTQKAMAQLFGVGDIGVEGVYHQGLCSRRRAAQAGDRRLW